MHDKLLKIQTELKAPKGQFNSFGKYRYRSCEDILEALKPLLAENGLTLTLSDDLILIGERFYVKATATVSSTKGVNTEDISHELLGNKEVYFGSVAQISVTAYAREEETKKGMDGSQITGAASSYARKYALNGLFLIDDTKDSDATNDHGTQKSNDPKDYPAPAQGDNEIDL